MSAKENPAETGLKFVTAVASGRSGETSMTEMSICDAGAEVQGGATASRPRLDPNGPLTFAKMQKCEGKVPLKAAGTLNSGVRLYEVSYGSYSTCSTAPPPKDPGPDPGDRKAWAEIAKAPFYFGFDAEWTEAPDRPVYDPTDLSEHDQPPDAPEAPDPKNTVLSYQYGCRMGKRAWSGKQITRRLRSPRGYPVQLQSG